MKLLVLNPHLSESHSLVRSLKATGAAVLLASTLEQARQLLQSHAVSLELAVIHRELHEGSGLDLIATIKASASTSDLPFIVTSSQWSEADFAHHQVGPDGANAYLGWSSCERDLPLTIEQVLGVSLASVSSEPQIKMEDATQVFDSSRPSLSPGSFRLEVDASDAISAERSIPVALSVEADGATRVLAVPDQGFAAPALVELQYSENTLGLPPTRLVSVTPELPVAIQIETRAQEDRPAAESRVFDELRPQQEPRQVTVAARSTTEDELATDLPYLFGQKVAGPMGPRPVGDSVVPGGAVQSPDAETLKRYLELREQDVGALSAQLRSAREQIRSLEQDLRQSHALMEEQSRRIDELHQRDRDHERDKELLSRGLQSEIDEMRFQMKSRTEKVRALEVQVRESAQEMERLKERVRNDFRKIRVKEKELENRLELVKKDSEAVLRARESTIMELKRKLDTAEFNMDLMQDRLAREKEVVQDLREKLLRASQAVRLAEGLLEPEDASSSTGTPGENHAATRDPFPRKAS